MTTPGGVPNLPVGALTVDTLASKLQDQSAGAMRSRAGDQFPSIFGQSLGGSPMADLSPFGILTNIWAGVNSLIAAASPSDIQGPDDLPPLFMDFIEGLPVVGQLVQLLEALSGNYDGDDPTLNAIQDLLAPIRLMVDTLLAALTGTYDGDDAVMLGIQELLAPIRSVVDAIGQTMAEWLGWLGENFSVEGLLKPLFEFLSWLWDGVSNGFQGFGGQVETLLKPLFEWLHWLWTQFGSSVDSFLKPIAQWLNWLWTQFGAAADTFLKPLFNWLKWLWDLFGSSVDTLLKPIFDFFHWLFGTLFDGALPALRDLFEGLKNASLSAGSMVSWVEQVPLIGPLVSIFTGHNPADGIALDLSTLGTWARNLLNGNSDIPAGNLKGLIPPAILSSIPLSNIAFDTPNLMSQGDFGNSGTIAANDGWSWDSSTNHSGSGGCAKVVCNGTARRLYSNQVIKVVAGDKLNLSAYVKTSNDFVGDSACVQLVLVPFVGTQRYTIGGNAVNVYFSQRGASSNWVQVTGSSGSGTAPWTVPAGVTSVRVRLSVTAAAASGTVWFDDIDLHKTGLLSGDWMNGILGTVAEDIQLAVDQIIQAIKGIFPGGTGNALTDILSTMQSVFTTLFGNHMPQLPTNILANPLQAIAIPGLDTSKITSGAFTSDYIGQDAIGSYQIADDAVGTAQIAPDAVTTSEIAPDAVTTSEIAPDAVGTSEIAPNAVTNSEVSGLDGTKITTGTVNINHIPTTAIGATINPSSGSGAQLVRVSSQPVAARAVNTRSFAPDGFFTSLSTASSDIRCLTTSGATATGTRNDYAGAFQVTMDGWYLVELSYRVNIGLGDAGFGVAPVLYKGSSLSSQTIYKVGTDCHFIWLVTTASFQRFVQNSFIVYLTANEIIRAGTDVNYGGTNPAPLILGGESNVGTSGAETYFSISLLNRSFA